MNESQVPDNVSLCHEPDQFRIVRIHLGGRSDITVHLGRRDITINPAQGLLKGAFTGTEKTGGVLKQLGGRFVPRGVGRLADLEKQIPQVLIPGTTRGGRGTRPGGEGIARPQFIDEAG